MFWVISVYFNIRNTLPKSGTFLLGHPVYSRLRLVFTAWYGLFACIQQNKLSLYKVDQRTNNHLTLVTPTPTRIMHYVMILIQTLLITTDHHLMLSLCLHTTNRILQIWPRREKNRKPKSRKRKTAVRSEWKKSKTKSLQITGHTYRIFKSVTDTLGATGRRKYFFPSCPSGKLCYFHQILVCGGYQSTKSSDLMSVNVTSSKTRKCLKLFQNVLLKKAYFDSLPISNTVWRSAVTNK